MSRQMGGAAAALCVGLMVSAGGGVRAELPYLVADLAPGEATDAGSFPAPLLPAADQMFFLSHPTAVDREPAFPQVWVSDGTAAGTRQVPELCVSSCLAGPVLVGALGRIAFFTETSSQGEDQLWRSDGTEAGTYRVGGGVRLVRSPNGFTVWNGRMHFIAYRGRTGPGRPLVELWRSDGTLAGTEVIAALGPGEPSPDSAILVAAGGKLFFTGPEAEPLAAFETLWVSDGTAPGTRRLRPLGPVDPRQITAAGRRVFFLAPTGRSTVPQLWTSDGSADGTLPLTQAPSGVFFWLASIGRRVYFEANHRADEHDHQLWASDGTAAGTRPVTAFPADSSFYSPVEVDGRLVFIAGSDGGPLGLWSVSARSPGPPEVVCPAPCVGIDSRELVKVGERVLFTPGDAWTGFELWSTDGTASGTGRLALMCRGQSFPPSQGQGPCDGADALRTAGGVAYFTQTRAPDGLARLWRTDGTSAGTARFAAPPLGYFLVAALPGTTFFVALDKARTQAEELWASDGPDDRVAARQLTDRTFPNSSWPMALRPLGDKLVFETGFGGPPWATDGTAAGTRRLTDATVSTEPTPATGGAIFFLSTQDGFVELWATDGTPAGTRQLTQVGEFRESVWAGPAPVAGGVLFARVGEEPAIWRSDGTPEGTIKMFDLPAGDWRGIGHLTGAAGEIYFVNDVNGGPREIWKSDGTTAGTARLAVSSCSTSPIRYSPCDAPSFTRAGATLYFIGYQPGRSYLGRSDGTASGTVHVVLAGFPILRPSELLTAGGTLYFFAEAVVGKRGLWRTDGTPAGTALLATFRGGDGGPHGLIAFGGGLAFAADDGLHGLELWTSDGTAAGTRMVADIAPGLEGSRPGGLAAAGGRLFFSANDGVHGAELWQSDGTAAGTRMVADLAPGPASSRPAGMTEAGGRLFFSADDGVSGRELWALPLGPLGAAAGRAGGVQAGKAGGVQAGPAGGVQAGPAGSRAASRLGAIRR